MFHIFGGLFQINSADDFLSSPDFLIEHDVIIVTFNYRLGAFGFLSLNTNEYSGNMGLKDQQLALKWTYNNIEYFGGDANRITILGHSSGSISANYHVINSESSKYISQFISMSGTATAHYALSYENHLCLMYEFARNISKPATDLYKLINVLKVAPTHKIFQFTTHDDFDGLINDFRWYPRLESMHIYFKDLFKKIYDKNNITSFGLLKA